MQEEDVTHTLSSYPKFMDLWAMVLVWSHNSLQRALMFIDLIGCIFAKDRDLALFSMVVWALWNR